MIDYLIWLDQSHLHAYIAWKGRFFLNPRKVLENPISANLQGLLPVLYNPPWREVWQPRRPLLPESLLHCFYMCPVTIHAWRHILLVFIKDVITDILRQK
jgi:hypothetical protein